jgi:hypothetical protein
VLCGLEVLALAFEADRRLIERLVALYGYFSHLSDTMNHERWRRRQTRSLQASLWVRWMLLCEVVG